MSTGVAAAFTLSGAGAGALAAAGSLTFVTAREARLQGLAALHAAGAAGPLDIDCSGLRLTDSAGLAVMLDWLAAAHAAKRPLRFVGLPRELGALARISNVEQLLTSGV